METHTIPEVHNIKYDAHATYHLHILLQKIPVFPEFKTMTTGHGKLGSYLYRFGLIDNPMCPSEEEKQTTVHLIFNCNEISKQRKEMIKQIKNTCCTWPLDTLNVS